MARRREPRKSGVTVAQLNRSLERGEIKPVYLVAGEEAFLRRKAIDALISAVAGEDADGREVAEQVKDLASFNTVCNADDERLA